MHINGQHYADRGAIKRGYVAEKGVLKWTLAFPCNFTYYYELL